MRVAHAAALGLLLAAPAALARDSGPAPGEGSPAWDGVTFRPMVDEARGIAFEVPMLGFRLEARHFGSDLPADRVTDAYALSGPDGVEEVAIELFEDRERLGAVAFFEKHLAFMKQGSSVERERMVGPERRAAIVVEQPSLPGSYARVAAVFALGSRVVRVTCVNGEDARAVAAYRRVLETITSRKAAR
jgi:hypothetical protein